MDRVPTRQRILDAAIDLFGTRGFEAVSLDEIAARSGVRKQTSCTGSRRRTSWSTRCSNRSPPSWSVVIEAAIRSASDDPLDRIDAVVRAVFRPAVRRPALLGLVREISRLPAAQADRLRAGCTRWWNGRRLPALEMDKGHLRRADPGLIAALGYATVTGIATEPEALRAVGWRPSAVGLRHLHRRAPAFLRAALAP